MWTKEAVAEKLATDDRWLVRGLLALYALQTEDEKATETTKHHNAVGFNGTDAPILSSFAEQYLRRSWLSEKQIALARRKMRKYAGQLARIANAS